LVLQEPRRIVLGVDQCPEKQEVDLCLPRGGIRPEVELNGRSGVSVWASTILPRVPMGWSSSITGDSTKDALNFP
jgi:hypothetical protein